MPFQPCRYLRYKELFSQELIAIDEDSNSIPTVAHAWCNLTLKEVGRDDCPVSMTACSKPGRICYRSYLEEEAKTRV
jgi:hypothetical protein